MSAKSAFIDQTVQEYVIDTTVREDPMLRELRIETSHRSNSQMQIGPEQGAFMQLLARTIGARRYLEIGVFTGYSSLAIAQALPPEGRIVACDVSEEYTAVARRYWKNAGVQEKIDLRLGPALATLQEMISNRTEPFDMAFIDADKENVGEYFERCIQLVRPGGLILVDNVLWNGAVADPKINDAETRALRELTARAAGDERLDVSLVAMCDGILIARKR